MPKGYQLCDGQNGTPDLRDKFLVGAGNSYGLGATGGNITTKLTTANLPPGALSGFFDGYYVTGVQRGDGTSFWNMEWGKTGQIAKYFGYYGTNAYLWLNSFSSSITLNGWNGTEFENRPPFYALYYIIKL